MTVGVGWGRGNKVAGEGWAAVDEALEGITSLTSLNQCPYPTCQAIRAGGQTEMLLGGKGLAVWAARYLPRSASTLTKLDLRSLSLSVSLSLSLSLLSLPLP